MPGLSHEVVYGRQGFAPLREPPPTPLARRTGAELVKPYPRYSIAYHKAGAPWPTCSCLECRRARARNDRSDGDDWKEAVRRLRTTIYRDLRRPDPDRL